MDLSARRPGPDVVRAVAMFGVVMMNYHGYLIIRGGVRGDGVLDDVFDPWTGPLSTRFAATFVLVAGIGVTLMTRSSVGDPQRTGQMRWRLVRRGLVLYVGGVLFDFIWPGTILPFYGVMFVLAAAMFTLRTRWLVLIGLVAALAGQLIRWWRYERELEWDRMRQLATQLGLEVVLPDHPTRWLTHPAPRSPRGLLFDVFVNGTHPLLPWLAFFCAGIVLGRLLPLPWWRAAAMGAGLALYSTAIMVNGLATTDRGRVLLSDNPFDRGLVYVASALGTALIAYSTISWIADRYESTAVIDTLRRAGQLSLSIYLGHALLFNLAVDWLDLIQPGGVATALAASIVYWVVAAAVAGEYQRRYGRGPAEQIYRHLTA